MLKSKKYRIVEKVARGGCSTEKGKIFIYTQNMYYTTSHCQQVGLDLKINLFSGKFDFWSCKIFQNLMNTEINNDKIIINTTYNTIKCIYGLPKISRLASSNALHANTAKISNPFNSTSLVPKFEVTCHNLCKQVSDILTLTNITVIHCVTTTSTNTFFTNTIFITQVLKSDTYTQQCLLNVCLRPWLPRCWRIASESWSVRLIIGTRKRKTLSLMTTRMEPRKKPLKMTSKIPLQEEKKRILLKKCANVIKIKQEKMKVAAKAASTEWLPWRRNNYSAEQSDAVTVSKECQNSSCTTKKNTTERNKRKCLLLKFKPKMQCLSLFVKIMFIISAVNIVNLDERIQ